MFAELAKAKDKLKSTATRGGTIDIESLIATEPTTSGQNEVRNYFFQAAVDKWYSSLEKHTFPSEFVPMTRDEAFTIISYWNDMTSKSSDIIVEIPDSLLSLAARIDDVITKSFYATTSESRGVFIKLSTRSPKDSKTLFRKAVEAFKQRLDDNGDIINPSSSQGDSSDLRDNRRLVALSEEMAKASVVTSGSEAVTYLLDSHRVAEDLMYAFEEGKETFNVAVVVRAWDSRVCPQCEFRGFVWDSKLNALGQYWHSLFFPELLPLKEQVAMDCLAFFDELKEHLPVPNAMLDLVWLGPGQVLLIEINPLMEGLGSFKGSTGLFDFYADRDVLTGVKPFEIRVRDQPEIRASLQSHMSTDWRRIVFGY